MDQGLIDRAARLVAEACREFADRPKVRAQQAGESKAKASHEAMQREYEALGKLFAGHARTPLQWRRKPRSSPQ